MTAPQPRFTITLESVAGELSKQQIRDLLKADLKLSDERISAIFESLPAVVLEDVDEITAVRMKQKLSWSGADVSIQPSAELGDDDETVRRPSDIGVDLRGPSAAGNRLVGEDQPTDEPAEPSIDDDLPWAGDQKVEVGGVPVDDLSWLEDKKGAEDIPGEGMSWLEEQKLKADELTQEEISSLQGDDAEPAEPPPPPDDGTAGLAQEDEEEPQPDADEPPAQEPGPQRLRPWAEDKLAQLEDEQVTVRIPPPGMPTPPPPQEEPEPPKPEEVPPEPPLAKIPTRTEIGVASPSEQRVERLKKTIGDAREEEEQFPPGETPYDDEPSDGVPRSAKYAITVCVLLLAAIGIAMFFVKEGNERRRSVQQQEQKQSEYDGHYQRGLRAEREGRYAEAIEAYEKAQSCLKDEGAEQAIERVRHLVRVQVAKDALKDGRIEDAIRAYELANEKQPTDEVRTEIARLREELKLRQTDETRVAHIRSLNDRVTQLEAAGEWQDAANTLKQLAQSGHSPAHRAYVRLARMGALASRSTPQPSDIKREQERKAAAWAERAKKHFLAGKETEAVRAARYALKLSPDHPTALRVIRQTERSQTKIETKVGTTSVTASVPKPRPRPTAVTRPPARVSRPAAPKAPVRRASTSAIWPTSRGSTWRYQSTKDRSLVTTYTALGPVIRGGISCHAYEISKTRNNSKVAPVRTLVLAQRPDGLYRVLDVGKELKHYETPLRVDQFFSYQSTEGLSQGAETKPTKVEVRTVGRETIRTPAGTFDCFAVKRKTRRVSFDPRTTQITSTDEEQTEWVSPGIGLIKMARKVASAIGIRKSIKGEMIELIQYQIR